jgi:hypothetical protein
MPSHRGDEYPPPQRQSSAFSRTRANQQPRNDRGSPCPTGKHRSGEAPERGLWIAGGTAPSTDVWSGPADEADRTHKSGCPGPSETRQPGSGNREHPRATPAGSQGRSPGQTLRDDGKPARSRRNGHPLPAAKRRFQGLALRVAIRSATACEPDRRPTIPPTPGSGEPRQRGSRGPGSPASHARGLSGAVSPWAARSLPPASPPKAGERANPLRTSGPSRTPRRCWRRYGHGHSRCNRCCAPTHECRRYGPFHHHDEK